MPAYVHVDIDLRGQGNPFQMLREGERCEDMFGAQGLPELPTDGSYLDALDAIEPEAPNPRKID